ncbi:fas-binding factor 1-like [Oppia nitens]|uniref:fas-binding factor 1-like n=1 Tax=Oppia nitens TaxID=1686743 RepID=UPI0023DC76F4|nr:fas-binding factor 1-like [Oppia nitens]
MSRLGSGGRSFLDELLSDDVTDKPINTSTKRKSVRFSDNDENSSDFFTTNTTSVTPNRSTISSSKDGQKNIDPLEWPTNDGSNASKSSTRQKTSKSDWLGLDSDEEMSRGFVQSAQPSVTRSVSNDWLNTGLNSRKNRPSNEPLKPSTDLNNEKSDDNSWLSIRKKAEESKIKSDEQIDEQKETKDQRNDNKNQSNDISINKTVIDSTTPVISNTTVHSVANIQYSDPVLLSSNTVDNTSSVMLLQTQLRIQEERDRRINDLRTQLSQCEKDMTDIKQRNNERVDYLENEWQREVQRLKEIHSSSIQKINEEHEHDLTRIRKIKEQEIESVNALQNHGLSLQSLLSKWEKSAQQIEDLHKDVIAKQEEILKHKLIDIDLKNKRMDEVEVNWHSLINELQLERSRCSDEQKRLQELIEQQKHLIQNEQKRLIDERLDLETNRKQLNEDRLTFDVEYNKFKDNMTKESQLLAEDRIKVKDELINLEIKRNELNLKELESQQNFNKEKNEIKLLFKEIEDKRNDLHKQQTEVQYHRMTIQSEQHSLEQKKLMFDMERNKMQDLAQEIAKRADELENLGQIALQEKREGHMAMDEAERFRQELDSKLKFIETSFAKLKTDEEKVYQMKVKVEQELEYIKEVKDNIVCSLCSSGLNRVKLNKGINKSSQDLPIFSSFYGLNNQWPTFQDDRSLLIWQITGQQDAALLEQETAFINGIRTQSQVTSGLPFQQNDYFIN